MSGPGCSICISPHVEAVNKALLAGERDSVVARRWQLGPDAVRRHRINAHFPPSEKAAAVAARAQDLEEGVDARSLVRKLRNAMIAIGQAASNRGDGRLALAAYDKAADAIELLEKIEGRLASGGVHIGQMNVVATGGGHDVAVRLLAALRPFPDALAAARRVLAEATVINGETEAIEADRRAITGRTE